MRVDLAWDEQRRQREPEPRMAGEDEGPVGGGVWYAHCASCCKVTTHSGFTDEHGCEIGGGCIECNWIWTPRACEFARAHKERDVQIIPATENIPVNHPVFLIFGQPGICKTSLAYSAKRTLLLDFDRGAHRAANRGDTLVIDSWADVEELMRSEDTLKNYSTLAVDTVGRCLDVLTAHLAKQDPKKFPGGVPSLQGWGTLKNTFRTWVAALRNLGLDVLLIAHDKEDKDGDTRIVRPEIAGGSYAEVMKISDFVGYVQMTGRDRVLDFNPTDRWIGKNPAGWAPLKVPPVGKAQTFLAELYTSGREALGHMSAESAAIAQQVEDWKAAIGTYTTAEECNRAITEIKKLPAITMPQVSKLLMDHAQAKAIAFDKGKKCFIDAEQPAGAVA